VCGGTNRLILDHRVERRDGGADFPPFEEADWFCAGCHNTKTARARALRAGGG
jgi:5-methylcytosine-specific restriction endonuclease McrA